MRDSTTDSSPDRAAQPQKVEPLGNAVGRGASWVMLGNVLGKLAALVAQVIIGLILTDVEFGVFASALAIGGFVGILRDGGTNLILLQRGAGAYEKVAGPLFWINATVSSVCAAIILGIGVGMAYFDPDHPQSAYVLYIVALSTPLQAVGGQLLTKLRQDLRFAKFSQIQLISAILRQVSTVGLALAGAGSMSMAWPFVFCALYEGVAAYRATREKVWKRPAMVHTWGGFIRQSWWTLFGTVWNFALDQGAYFVMGFTVSKAVTGQFYFAFQLVAQTGVILGYAVQQVLIPALVRLNDHPERQADAAMRSLRVMTLVGAIVCVGVSVGIAPLRAILWPDKWLESVPAIIILGMFFSWRIQFGLTTALLHAQGRFKRHAFFTLLEGGGVMAVTLIASLLPKVVPSIPEPNVTTLAWWVGSWLVVGRIIVSVLTFKHMHVPTREVLGATIWSWLIAVAAGLATLALDHYLNLETRLRDIATQIVQSIGPAHPKPWMIEVPAQAFRLMILGGACMVLFLAAVRSLQRDTLAATLLIVPARLRPLASRMLGLTKAAEQVMPE